MDRKLYYNGPILTMNEAAPVVDYVLTEGDKIVEIGMADGLAKHLAAGTDAVDLQGRMMLPGFIDSHLHMLSAALNQLKLDLTDLTFDTIDDMLAYVKKEKGSSGDSWISAFAFFEENIGEHRIVTRQDIDKVFPDIPVTIIRVCGHMGIINSKAMEKLDPEKMANIVGGEFKKDANGEYNGQATEGALQYVLDNMPAADEETILKYLQGQQQYLISQGLTAIHDAGTDMMMPHDYVDIFEKMNEKGLLKIRTYLMARPGEDETPESFEQYLSALKAKNSPDGRLTIGAVKMFSDGSLGGRTAAINEHYQDEPDNTGLLLNERIDQYADYLINAGHQMAIHAIGDRSTGYVADTYCRAANKEGTRQRIEHAELLNDELIDTFKKNNIYIMTQPIFIREFGVTYFNNLGQDRAMQIQPLKTLLEKGIVVGFGTDYPVDDPNPLLGIHAAMTRQIKNCDKLLNEAEKISFADAVKCYTYGSACGAFCESAMGSIEPGKFADFVVLSGLQADASGTVTDVTSAVVDLTIIGGETLYSREG